MIDELHQVCGRLERDPKLLLLAGRGDHFAGGAGIAEPERADEEAFAGINPDPVRPYRESSRCPPWYAVRRLCARRRAELTYAL
ncbi:unnamed protein product, partial [Mesorhabditis spiculigera]